MSNLYKVLGPNAESIHGGSTWNKPHGARPGKWMPEILNPSCCNRGYHLVELFSLAEWLRYDCTIYLAEGKGPSNSDNNGKTAFSQARLIRRLHLSEQDVRLFACDCAEHVLKNFTGLYPNDDRPAIAIQTARAFAVGNATEEELASVAAAAASAYAAAGAASSAYSSYSYSAAASAAAAAAASAYSSAAAAYSYSYSAASAAYAAAASAYSSAAYSAARRAERQWQSEVLATYLK